MTATPCPPTGEIDDWIDGALAPEAAARAAAHLAACPSCAALADDLTRLRALARGLEPLPPPPRVWTRLQAQLDTEAAPAGPAWLRAARLVAPLAAAASLLLALGLLGAALRPAATPPEVAEAPRVETPPAPEAALTTAIDGLEVLAREGRDALEPALAEVIQTNLVVIDQAIAESRAAVADEPEDPLAQDALAEALARKMALLEDTVALVADARVEESPDAALLDRP